MTRRRLRHRLFWMLAASAIVAAFLLLSASRAGAVPAADATVGTGSAGSCNPLTLQTALDTVQSTGGGAIDFDCGDTPVAIVVSSTLTISSSVVFNGGSPGAISLSGGNSRRVFYVLPAANLTLNDMVVALGRQNDGYGGCIFSAGAALTLTHTLVHTCRSGPEFPSAGGRWPESVDGSPASAGGAIYSSIGAVSLVNSQVLTSSAEWGGGIVSGGSLSLVGSHVAGNEARDSAGGISASGFATITESLIEHNESGGFGGGIVATTDTHLTIESSRLYSNTAATLAGGLYIQGVFTSTDSIFEENLAGGNGGGIYQQAGTALLSGAIVRDNWAGDDGGGMYGLDLIVFFKSRFEGNFAADDGGGLFDLGSTAGFVDTDFVDNEALSNAGGMLLEVDDGAHLIRVRIIGNRATHGGGLHHDGGPLILEGAIIANNHATDGAGIDHNGGKLTISGATISGNQATADGGGYFDANSGEVAMTNVTFSGNSAGGVGGGLKTEQTLTMTNVTIANNTAGSLGGGLYRSLPTFPYLLRNVLLAGNTGAAGADANCSGPSATAIASLSTDNTCAFGAGSNANAPLSALQINGALASFLMPTHLPLGGDPIDGGTLAGCPPTDQRGAGRPAGSTCDVGAVEADSMLPRLWLPVAIQD
jgi:hypothetical protein